MTHQSASQVVREFLEGPLTRPALLLWRRRQFLSREGHGFYFGLFDSFNAAREWLPKSPEFNCDALAEEYVNVRTRKIFAYDYPIMWWLDRAFLAGAMSILDIGGSVGVHYYAYRRYLDMPTALKWRIVEVPTMNSIGRKLAVDTGASALDFTEDLERAVTEGTADIWISAGAIHYIEDATPGRLLKNCKTRPQHLLLNKLPLYEGESFVTTQNIGAGCFAPMHVYNRGRFVRDIEATGYTLRDEWPVHERSLYLPGHPERSFPSFTGLYFSDPSAAGHFKRAGELDDAGRGSSCWRS
ncbi:methyltransferase, TIGR04325 family [Variovorax sp. RT4R15]|uniref:methyltransferase, TIGR04325 family n=1 Tax=Variovorax sp. RT4R15 TaxID=3443737 RepID=UPI003F45FF5E